MRTLTLVLLCALGCRDGGASNVDADALRFDTAPIVFEDTWVGTVRSVSLEVTNPARVRQSLTTRIDAPFSVRPPELSIGGGSTEVVTLTFSPLAAGESRASLILGGTSIEVRGAGLAIPECVAPTACEDARFDTGVGVCRTEPRADGASCEQQCLTNATCQAGACVGQPQDCGDGDACTVDACGSGGCTHAPVTCPAPSNPCKVPSCDPGTGCGEVDADDGVVCGAESCLETTVSVCIGGACVPRTRPATQRCTNTWAPVALPAGNTSALAWDPVRSRMVRLVYAQTWLWDGEDWTQRFPANAPPPGSWRWFATDTHRNRVVTTLNGQTWEWDGTTWLFRADDVMTPGFPMGFAALAYDVKRRRTVVFGGFAYGGSSLDSTWEWDGMRWTRRTPAHHPTARAGTMLAYDPVRERVVLFGGADENYDEHGDTWEWDGADWTQRTLSPSPLARYSGTLTWNPVRGTLMLLGGTNYDPLDQPWEYDGVAWKPLPALGLPLSQHGAAWDPLRQITVVMHNGKTWSWDGATLTLLSKPSPSPRTAAGVTFDEARDTVTLFGGYPNVPINWASVNETWQFSDGGWTELAVNPRPAPRYGMTFVYDPLRARTVMFGGTSEINTQGGLVGQKFSDLWDWDGTSWTQRTPLTTPPQGVTRASIWDPVRQRVAMVAQDGSLWTLDDRTWVRDENTAGWSVTSLAFDEQSQRLMGTLNTQTAAFVDGGWQLLGAPLPNSSYGPRIAWVPNLQRVMAQVNSVTYRWADGGWVDLQPGTTLPTPTHALVYDGATQRLMALTASDQWVYLP